MHYSQVCIHVGRVCEKAGLEMIDSTYLNSIGFPSTSDTCKSKVLLVPPTTAVPVLNDFKLHQYYVSSIYIVTVRFEIELRLGP